MIGVLLAVIVASCHIVITRGILDQHEQQARFISDQLELGMLNNSNAEAVQELILTLAAHRSIYRLMIIDYSTNQVSAANLPELRARSLEDALTPVELTQLQQLALQPSYSQQHWYVENRFAYARKIELLSEHQTQAQYRSIYVQFRPLAVMPAFWYVQVSLLAAVLLFVSLTSCITFFYRRYRQAHAMQELAEAIRKRRACSPLTLHQLKPLAAIWNSYLASHPANSAQSHANGPPSNRLTIGSGDTVGSSDEATNQHMKGAGALEHPDEGMETKNKRSSDTHTESHSSLIQQPSLFSAPNTPGALTNKTQKSSESADQKVSIGPSQRPMRSEPNWPDLLATLDSLHRTRVLLIENPLWTSRSLKGLLIQCKLGYHICESIENAIKHLREDTDIRPNHQLPYDLVLMHQRPHLLTPGFTDRVRAGEAGEEYRETLLVLALTIDATKAQGSSTQAATSLEDYDRVFKLPLEREQFICYLAASEAIRQQSRSLAP